LLLEKAYAKLHGNYFQLRGGFTSEALIDLTGWPGCWYDFEDELIKMLIHNGEFWELFKLFDSEGYLMSASTPGEERFIDPGQIEDDDQLKSGFSYSIIMIKETQGNKLINLRNPWGSFRWEGDWSPSSALWTEELRKEINPMLEENDGTFWMGFDDFIRHFRSLNVWRVRNWEEVRIKGKFIRVQNIDDPDVEIVLSKWYYSLDVNEPTRVFIGIHQEDERIENVSSRRSYLDIGVAVLRRTGDNNVELIDLKDLNIDRQCELDVTLEPGSYIILPRTSGCYLRRPQEAKPENIKLMDIKENFHELFDLTLNDIFRKFDMLLNRELSYTEFRGFYECLGKNINESEFRNEILEKYWSSNRGITLRGFKEFWRDSIKNYGEDTICGWLENLGYDEDLYSIRSRWFVITMHSETELAVTVRDAVQTDLDNRWNIAILANYGQELDKTNIFKAIYTFSEQIHAYSYGVFNISPNPIIAQIDWSSSTNMVFSPRTNIIKKRVEPGELEFFLHGMGISSADEFVRSAKCSVLEVVND
jgi:calpain-15